MDYCHYCGEAWSPFSGFIDAKKLVCVDCMKQALIGELGYPIANTRKKGQGSKWIRRERRWAFYARDSWTCLYCEARPAGEAAVLSLDHFHPVSKEATDAEKARSATPDNIVTLCVSCNSSRQDVPTATFVRRLEERGLDPEVISRRVSRQRALKFDPVILSPWRPTKAHLDLLRRRHMRPTDYAATTSRLLEAVGEAAKRAPSSAASAAAIAAAALEETVRRTGVGGIEGVRAAQIAREASAATGIDVGLTAAAVLIRDAPEIAAREVWAADQAQQRRAELRLLLESLSE